ncbi:MAG: LodA/GoxA family CTQ-dependent oxidase [Chloroflexota bacterium]
MATFKIHPAIGVARLGNDDDFYLSPEQPGQLPILCDEEGRAIPPPVFGPGPESDTKQPPPLFNFKDPNDLSSVLRQGARFKVYAYNSDSEPGHEIAIGDIFPFGVENAVVGQEMVLGVVADIEWTVHLANKKSSWYQFMETQGMHGYAPAHPLRNADVTAPDERRQLIIDPGPQTVSCQSETSRHKHFARDENPGYPQSFPPPDIEPNPIDTLGELIANQQTDEDGKNHNRLIVLGGRGNAGSSESPVIIKQYANNDGWFDDTSDGPVTARIRFAYLPDSPDYDNTHFQLIDGNKDIMVSSEGTIPDKPVSIQVGDKFVETRVHNSYVDVDIPAWVVVGLPRFAPQILDMITMDEAMYDLFVRHSAYTPQLFGVAPYDAASNAPQSDSEWTQWRANAQYNPDYYPWFYRDIWPILERPFAFNWVYTFDPSLGGDPHNTGTNGSNLDQTKMSATPKQGFDEFRQQRQFIYNILRKPGQENMYRSEVLSQTNANYRPRAMPELCGNNPLSNTAPEKFLRLNETQLFLLKQWAEGKFINEFEEWDKGDAQPPSPLPTPPYTGEQLDRGVLGNVAGGAFCPGMEITWSALNPAIYSDPYRIKHAPYQPGQLTLPKAATDADPGNPSNSFADLSQGLEPGDLTKYMALPWQSDFTQCTEQPIDVTYENWNNLYLDSTGDPAKQNLADNVPWWPAHRPIVVMGTDGSQYYWASGIPENNVGGLRMVTAWKDLGFLFGSAEDGYYLQEYNEAALGPLVKPGHRRLGNTKSSIVDE